MSVVLGLDVSTRACAVVAVPTDWGGDWSRVVTFEIGIELEHDASDDERARRTGEIAREVVRFARKHGAVQAWFESYAFNMRTMAHTLGEVCGVIRLELLREGVALRTGNMSTARKLLLGKIPRGQKGKGAAKKAVVETLEAAGAAFRTVDQAEAFVVANLGLSLEHEGAYFFGQVAA